MSEGGRHGQKGGSEGGGDGVTGEGREGARENVDNKRMWKTCRRGSE
jgi:hypothetical protein